MRILIVFVWCLVTATVFAQAGSDRLINRLYVDSDYSSAMVFEYARVAFTEGAPINSDTIKCFESELMSTGLFDAVSVVLENVKGGKVDVRIRPVFQQRVEIIKVGEIKFQGFENIDKTKLIEDLSQRGVTVGMIFSHSRIAEIKSKVHEVIDRSYAFDSRLQREIQEQTSDLSVRIKSISKDTVSLTLLAGKNDLCQ